MNELKKDDKEITRSSIESKQSEPVCATEKEKRKLTPNEQGGTFNSTERKTTDGEKAVHPKLDGGRKLTEEKKDNSSSNEYQQTNHQKLDSHVSHTTQRPEQNNSGNQKVRSSIQDREKPLPIEDQKPGVQEGTKLQSVVDQKPKAQEEVKSKPIENQKLNTEDDIRTGVLYERSNNDSIVDRDASYKLPGEDDNRKRKEQQGENDRHYAPTLSEALRDKDLFKDYQEGEYSSNKYGKSVSQTLSYSPDVTRDTKAQRAAGGDARRPDDHGFHLIAVREGGDPGEKNLSAGNRNLNQGAYKQQEMREIGELKNGSQGFKHVESYSSSGSERPVTYMGYTVMEHPDGTRTWDAFSYTNESATTQEKWNQELDTIPDDNDIPNAMHDRNYEELHKIADDYDAEHPKETW